MQEQHCDIIVGIIQYRKFIFCIFIHPCQYFCPPNSSLPYSNWIELEIIRSSGETHDNLDMSVATHNCCNGFNQISMISY
jgi:hypothetical protein